MSNDPSDVPADARSDLIRQLVKSGNLKEKLDTCRSAGIFFRAVTALDVERNPIAPSSTHVRVAHGGVLFVNVRDYVGRELFVHGAYEQNVSAFLVRSLKEGDCFIDVGAHFGYFSHLAASRVGETGKVLAVEPGRNTLGYLRRNSLHLAQIEIHAVAAWHKRETIEFQDYGAENSCLNTAVALRWHRSDKPMPQPIESYNVEAVPLDEIASTVKPKIVKVDVESAEANVFRGMKRILAEDRPTVIFEVGDIETARNAGAPSSSQLISMMRELGYDVLEISANGRLSRCQFDESKPVDYMNLAAIPTGSGRSS